MRSPRGLTLQGLQAEIEPAHRTNAGNGRRREHGDIRPWDLHELATQRRNNAVELQGLGLAIVPGASAATAMAPLGVLVDCRMLKPETVMTSATPAVSLSTLRTSSTMRLVRSSDAALGS